LLIKRKKVTNLSSTVKTIFISHSADDHEINRFFRDAFDDTVVEPVMMENKKWSRGNEANWMWIKKEIQNSGALFVLLTKSVVSKIQTQNWMSFEIGVAAAFQKPVYVFNEEEVNFPMPYLNHYFPNRTSVPSRSSGDLVNFSGILDELKAKSLLQGLIKNPKFVYEDKMYQCHTCKTIFSYWKIEDSFYCPCCKSFILRALSGYHPPTS
jgi:hypothetical protein